MSSVENQKKCAETNNDAPNLRDTVVMFVDIVGASEASDYKKPSKYSTFVTQFQELFRKVCTEYTKALYEGDDYYLFSARGDEGLFMLYPPNDKKNLSTDVDTAINIALTLKRRWVCDTENKKRICTYGLLPIDLGIGIHVGKTYINQLRDGQYEKEYNPGGWRPEGYSINLAKRIENESRTGKYTRIFVSDAVHGELNYLPDEQTYVFDEQQRIQPKGISRDIRVFEVKHHFLPTDWSDLSATQRRSKSFVDPDEVDISVLLEAHRMNPTNIWLAQECIRASMLQEYYKLAEDERYEKGKLKVAFQKAREIAADLAHGDQRDAGVLFIQGFIEGECLDFDIERKRYEEARGFARQLSIVDWYEALSYASEVWYAIDRDNEKTYEKLVNVIGYTGGQLKELINKAEGKFKEARERSPRSAWIRYDYGRELVRWNETSAKRSTGINEIKTAFDSLPDQVARTVEYDEYLNEVKDTPIIKEILAHAEELEESGT